MTQLLTISINDVVKTELERFCNENNEKKSSVVRKAVMEFIKNEKEKAYFKGNEESSERDIQQEMRPMPEEEFATYTSSGSQSGQ